MIMKIREDVIIMNEKLMYSRIRNICGFLGMILPYLALFSAGIISPKPGPTWWWSISATYYQSPALAGILTAASIVLMTYDGYTKIDNIVTSCAGIFGIMIVLFPCEVEWLDYNYRVGFFQLPMKVSMIIHNISAGLFFSLLAINCLFLFTKTADLDNMTSQKKIRNKIYRICGIGMFIFGIWQGIYQLFGLPKWITMINEIILLQLFGFSWLTKGGVFYRDKD